MPRARSAEFQWGSWTLGLLALFLLVALLPVFNPNPEERSRIAWNLEPGIGRQASLLSNPSGESFELNVLALDSPEPWRVRITRPIELTKDESLTIRFLARAEMDHPIDLIVREGQAPYTVLGQRLSAPIGSGWTPVEHSVIAPHPLVDGRIEILAGQSLGKLEIKEVRIEKHPSSAAKTISRSASRFHSALKH